MSKWYENEVVDQGIIISSRVRLARNLKKYPFPNRLTEQQSSQMLEEMKQTLITETQKENLSLQYIPISQLNSHEKLSMMERHIISLPLVEKKQPCGIMVREDERLSIMMNEEDHIRIQVVLEGENLKEAWHLANETDNQIEEGLEYAFDEKYGYLTACPTNVGTGLRASYMMHLPCLEITGQIPHIIQAISKFGITVRGIYGEGTDPLGSIYQISNQVTLGQSEEEIMNNLNRVSKLVLEQEIKIRQKLIEENKEELEDKIYRSYGILANARKISGTEAMAYLSNIREGFLLKLLEIPKPKTNICQMMMQIQPGNLQSCFDGNLSMDKRDHIRAKYIREQFE